jgi:1,4-dihydroxy-2-naphthoate octaprenyltransferase
VTRAGAWLLALRPRTLPAAVAPVLVGSAAAARAGALRPGLALVALATALSLQVGANLVNDWADFRRGADGPDRLGPVRVTQAGLIAPRAVARGGILAFTVAATLGLVLIAAGGWPVALAGGAAIAAGVAYTAGPWPLAYHGLGEVFVFLFFGPVGVCGTELVQAGRISPAALAASLPVGLMASAILVVNNVRDVDGDRRAAKRTLAVRFGRGVGRAVYVAVVGTAFAALGALAFGFSAPAVLVALGAMPLAVAPVRAVLTRTDGPALNAALAATARLHLVFGALLAGGLAW